MLQFGYITPKETENLRNVNRISKLNQSVVDEPTYRVVMDTEGGILQHGEFNDMNSYFVGQVAYVIFDNNYNVTIERVYVV